jgi:phage/plasmid-associated DNA primase
MKNGLYNIITGEFREYTPDYLSRNQCNGKYVSEVLYPSEISGGADDQFGLKLTNI